LLYDAQPLDVPTHSGLGCGKQDYTVGDLEFFKCQSKQYQLYPDIISSTTNIFNFKFWKSKNIVFLCLCLHLLECLF